MPRPRRDSPTPVRVSSGRSTAMPSFNSVAVIGAGAWGTALAGVAARAGRDVVLYARDSLSAAHIAATRINPKLSGVALEVNVRVTDDIALAAAADIVLIATPAQPLRAAVTSRAPPLVNPTPRGAVRPTLDFACPSSGQATAGDPLRQGHRARQPQIHDRGDRGGRA